MIICLFFLGEEEGSSEESGKDWDELEKEAAAGNTTMFFIFSVKIRKVGLMEPGGYVARSQMNRGFVY